MDCRAKDGEMRRVHREMVDVLAPFGRDGRLEPCVVVLKDCRAFRIDEVLMASGFGPVHHGKRTAASAFVWVAGKRSCSWSISWKTPLQARPISMYGGCALSTERSEAPPKAAADSRYGVASACGAGAAGVGGGRCGRGGARGVRVRIEPGWGRIVVDVAAGWCNGVLRCRWPRAALRCCGTRALGRFGAAPDGKIRASCVI